MNDQRVRELVGRGATDLLDVARSTGAGSFCGGCAPTIASLISAATGEPPSALLDRAPSNVESGTSTIQNQLRRVVRAIEEEVAAVGWVPGARIGDQSELARRYQTSRALVSRALEVAGHHGFVRVAEGTTDVQAAAPDQRRVASSVASYLQVVGVTTEEVEVARHALSDVAPHHAAGGSGSGVCDVDGVLARVMRQLEVPARPADRGAETLTVVDELYAALVHEVAGGGRRPGDVIGTERDIADAHGIDRRSVHRAALLLEANGMANRQPGPMATISTSVLDRWPTAELLAVHLDATSRTECLLRARAALDVVATGLAASVAGVEGIERLWERLAEERQAVLRSDEGYSTFHSIHTLLSELSGNSVVSQFALATNLTITRRANRDDRLLRFFRQREEAIGRAHLGLVRAVAEGRAKDAQELMRSHLRDHGPPPDTTRRSS